MRLLQFRFAGSHKAIAHQIGQKIQGIFSVEDDGEVKAISSERESGPHYILCGLDAVGRIASNAFEKSFAGETCYGEVFAISSLGSCRFVVFEADGLMRICVSNDDSTDFFDEFDIEGEDVSNLLVSSDIFDYL